MPTNNVYQEEQIPTQLSRSWHAFRSNTPAMFGFWCLCALLFTTIFAPWLAPYDPQHQTGVLLIPPSWDSTGRVEFFLGTDDLTRDVLSRLIMGSPLTFGYAIVIAFSSAVVGSLIGVLAGMTRGLVSSVLNHVLDTVLSIPTILLAIIVVAFFGLEKPRSYLPCGWHLSRALSGRFTLPFTGR